MNQTLTTIPKLIFSEPCHNLPGRKGTVTAEDHFTIAFMRAYLDQAERIHKRSKRSQFAFAREIPVNGYGIADLLVVAWERSNDDILWDTRDFIRIKKPCSRAFECKLTDWRKAMSQAIRYRYFSNQAIVILPSETCTKALPYLDTFQKIRVGLWEFSSENGRITTHYTPRHSPAISDRYYLRAIESVSQASNLTLPIL